MLWQAICSRRSVKLGVDFEHITNLDEVRIAQLITTRLIFAFPSRYPKFWFGKISSDLNLIYKISKFNITSEHPTNFGSSKFHYRARHVAKKKT
jgi:hypothetical protein